MQKINYILISVLVCFSFLASSQNFKVKKKKNPGQSNVQLNYIQFNAKSGLKSNFKGVRYNSLALQVPGVNKSKEFSKIIYSNDKPIFFEKKNIKPKSALNHSMEEKFQSVVGTINNEFSITNSNLSFEITKSNSDNLGIQHLNSIQKYKNIPIYGSESGFHFWEDKLSFTGTIHNANHDLNVIPGIDAETAINIVKNDLLKETTVKQLTTTQQLILDYRNPECELKILETAGEAYFLAFEITIRPNFIEQWKYFIDARNGSIIRKYNNTFTDGPTSATALDLNGVLQTIETYMENGKYFLINIKEEMFNARFPAERVARVQLQTATGDWLDSGEVQADWDVANPPTDAELREKFRWLATDSLAKERATALEGIIWHCANLSNVSSLLALLTPAQH